MGDRDEEGESLAPGPEGRVMRTVYLRRLRRRLPGTPPGEDYDHNLGKEERVGESWGKADLKRDVVSGTGPHQGGSKPCPKELQGEEVFGTKIRQGSLLFKKGEAGRETGRAMRVKVPVGGRGRKWS